MSFLFFLSGVRISILNDTYYNRQNKNIQIINPYCYRNYYAKFEIDMTIITSVIQTDPQNRKASLLIRIMSKVLGKGIYFSEKIQLCFLGFLEGRTLLFITINKL